MKSDSSGTPPLAAVKTETVEPPSREEVIASKLAALDLDAKPDMRKLQEFSMMQAEWRKTASTDPMMHVWKTRKKPTTTTLLKPSVLRFPFTCQVTFQFTFKITFQFTFQFTFQVTFQFTYDLSISIDNSIYIPTYISFYIHI
jgi:hypothetical protein